MGFPSLFQFLQTWRRSPCPPTTNSQILVAPLMKTTGGHQSLKLGRRKFLGLGSAALVGLSLKSEKKIEGRSVNDSFQTGHLLRDRRRVSHGKAR